MGSIRVYKEEFCPIKLNLCCHNQESASEQHSETSQQTSSPSDVSTPEVVKSSLEVENVQLDRKNYFLELSLSSPEFNTQNERSQSQPLDLDELSYYWNCKISNSGQHKLDLTFRIVDPSNPSKAKTIRTIERNVKVVEMLGLTGNEVKGLKDIVGAAVMMYTFLHWIRILP
jgi:hypothetical protein